jgi:hypothetical protein
MVEKNVKSIIFKNQIATTDWVKYPDAELPLRGDFWAWNGSKSKILNETFR